MDLSRWGLGFRELPDNGFQSSSTEYKFKMTILKVNDVYGPNTNSLIFEGNTLGINSIG